MTVKDSHFDRASLIVVGSVGRVKRRFAVATGCSARLLRHFRAGADAKVAARGQAAADTSQAGVAQGRFVLGASRRP